MLLSSASPICKSTQSLRRVVHEVPLACLRGGGRVEEGIAVLRDEEEEQAVDEAEQLAVVVLCIELARLQCCLELAIMWVREEAAAECGDRLLDTCSQCV